MCPELPILFFSVICMPTRKSYLPSTIKKHKLANATDTLPALGTPAVLVPNVAISLKAKLH